VQRRGIVHFGEANTAEAAGVPAAERLLPSRAAYFFFGGTIDRSAPARGRPTFGCAAGVARGGVIGSRSFGRRRESEYAVLVDRGC
jgi:hypothetical protein